MLAAKLLHGWLQNRHQTLVPLSLNFSRLSPSDGALLARGLAALLSTGRPPRDAGAGAETCRAWLVRFGADAAMQEAFAAALDQPDALGPLFADVQAAGLGVHLFVLSLAASDPRFPASTLLPDLVQARLGIASAVARTAVRRYGG